MTPNLLILSVMKSRPSWYFYILAVIKTERLDRESKVPGLAKTHISLDKKNAKDSLTTSVACSSLY